MLKMLVGGWRAREFITKWDTTKAGTSTSTQITIPTVVTGSYNCVVNWGDGNTSTITTYNDAAWTHTYSAAGIYVVSITGTFRGFVFNNGGDKLKLLKVDQWGTMQLGTSEGGYFNGCANLIITAIDILDLTVTTSLASAFRSCSLLRTIPSVNFWDTSSITNMTGAFAACVVFNKALNGWNTSNVTNMSAMFQSCLLFNQNLGSWNTSNVTDMSSMFNTASAFNGNIGSWNTSSVTNMSLMFINASVFNQNIGSWNTSNVTDMNNMLRSCLVFNQNIGAWNTSKVTNMSAMFQSCLLFNQNIGSWNTSNVTIMNQMFSGATSFNQSLSGWNTSKVTTMNQMFNNATSFNQNIGSWNVTALVGLGGGGMFTGVTLSNANYNNLLAGWAAQVVRSGVTFSGGNSHYDTTSGGVNGVAARATLTTTYTWIITDGGTP